MMVMIVIVGKIKDLLTGECIEEGKAGKVDGDDTTTTTTRTDDTTTTVDYQEPDENKPNVKNYYIIVIIH